MLKLQQKQKDVGFFYELLNDFMNEVIDVYPEERVRIERYRMLMNAARKANHLTAIRAFYDAVEPFRKQIEDCDEHYFLDESKMEEIAEGDEQTLVEGLALKRLWCHKNTTMEIKAAIWSYLHELIKAAEKVM